MDLEPCVNTCFPVSFTVSSPRVLMNSNTVNLWTVCSSAKLSWTGAAATFIGDFVSGSNCFHTSQNVFFPRPVKDVTCSQAEK